MHRLSFLALFTVAAVTLAYGCGPPPTAAVSGTASVKGTPITFGSITFQTDAAGVSNPVATGEIREGKYALKGVPVGPAKIGVQSMPVAKPGTPPPGMKAMVGDTKTNPPKGPYVPVPSKFAQPGTSGLTCEVKSGEQQHDIDIVP